MSNNNSTHKTRQTTKIEAEDILDDFKAQVWAMKREDVIKVMEEYGKQMWNEAIKEVADWIEGPDRNPEFPYAPSKETILKWYSI